VGGLVLGMLEVGRKFDTRVYNRPTLVYLIKCTNKYVNKLESL
jgi:hypothetical protein